MLNIIVLGKGLIPRISKLAPVKTPFKADLTLIQTIINTPGLQVKYIDPETNTPKDLTKNNCKGIWDKYVKGYNIEQRVPAYKPPQIKDLNITDPCEKCSKDPCECPKTCAICNTEPCHCGKALKCPDCDEEQCICKPPERCGKCGEETCICREEDPPCEKCEKNPCECPQPCERCNEEICICNQCVKCFKDPCECIPEPEVCETCKEEPCVCIPAADELTKELESETTVTVPEESVDSPANVNASQIHAANVTPAPEEKKDDEFVMRPKFKDDVINKGNKKHHKRK